MCPVKKLKKIIDQVLNAVILVSNVIYECNLCLLPVFISEFCTTNRFSRVESCFASSAEVESSVVAFGLYCSLLE